jgi:AraC-like DNA-binding protein
MAEARAPEMPWYVPRVESFGGLRKALAAVFDPCAEPETGFRGDIAIWSTEHTALTDITASRTRLIRSSDTIAQSQIDHFAITMLASGSMAALAGETEVDGCSGDIFFKDMSQTFSLQTSLHRVSTRLITLWIPRSRLLRSVSNEHALHGLVLKRTSPAGAVLGAGLKSFAEQVPHMTAREMDWLADGVIQLAAKALIPIFEATNTGSGVALASFVSIRRFIDRSLGSPELGVAMIVKNFGLSRPSLYRLFEPIGGVAGYIRKQRLSRAFQDVTSAEKADHRIGPMAYRLGFKNINSFNRAFRETYGKTPGEARGAARVGSGATRTLPSNPLCAGILAQCLGNMMK